MGFNQHYDNICTENLSYLYLVGILIELELRASNMKKESNLGILIVWSRYIHDKTIRVSTRLGNGCR